MVNQSHSKKGIDKYLTALAYYIFLYKSQVIFSSICSLKAFSGVHLIKFKIYHNVAIWITEMIIMIGAMAFKYTITMKVLPAALGNYYSL